MWGEHHRTWGPGLFVSQHSCCCILVNTRWALFDPVISDSDTQTHFKYVVMKGHLALAWAGSPLPSSASCLSGSQWKGSWARRWPSSCGPHFCGHQSTYPSQAGEPCALQTCFLSNLWILYPIISFKDSDLWEPKPGSHLFSPQVCVIPSLR